MRIEDKIINGDSPNVVDNPLFMMKRLIDSLKQNQKSAFVILFVCELISCLFLGALNNILINEEDNPGFGWIIILGGFIIALVIILLLVILVVILLIMLISIIFQKYKLYNLLKKINDSNFKQFCWLFIISITISIVSVITLCLTIVTFIYSLMESFKYQTTSWFFLAIILLSLLISVVDIFESNDLYDKLIININM
ncbi:hypothetical protein BG261_03500 [Floricoccus tropicus]|uniref:Uncharacterized protein n=2 Tax=Floricoccus tropicus TaxID=1859473 RepID=A0A1E8GN41_9LACT|nr:hypothetical protein BG261_03500 [Floricoccus tropicus]